jgi:RNA polymerase sigma factor (TIGR02999 family)
MGPASPADVTRLLQAWSKGDEHALGRVIPLIYRELRQRAHRCMRGERPGHSLQTSALINEAYLRLAGAAPVAWESRSHFFSIAARMMRRILVDRARARRSLKRGGEDRLVTLDEQYLVAGQPPRDLVTLDDALTALSGLDPRKGRVVELRFFGGLSVEETADVLAVSPQTVMRDWKLREGVARAGDEARRRRGGREGSARPSRFVTSAFVENEVERRRC